ncbi:MAG: hypothetical protein CM1200mP2_24300 [Planctomycetaceae bacterium]|nr:MAG: hypothetical protein CM1200mP2_24300 [Planctomycetaceae bacterium]
MRKSGRRVNSIKLPGAAYQAGNLREGMEIVRRCLDADPDDGRAWELCGLIHYSGGHFSHSVYALESASALVPLRPAGRVCLGHAYAKVNRVGLACDLLTDLIDDDSISEPLLLRLRWDSIPSTGPTWQFELVDE